MLPPTAEVGFSVSPALGDPRLTLMQNGAVVAQNDDWGAASNASAVATAITSTGALALHPTSKDAAILITLAPGACTAHVTSIDGSTGVALVAFVKTLRR